MAEVISLELYRDSVYMTIRYKLGGNKTSPPACDNNIIKFV